MKVLESYHCFITLRFHDSGNKESYVSFWKKKAHFSNYFYFLFFRLTFHADLSIGLFLRVKPATNLNLIAFRSQQMLDYVNFICM